MAYVIVLLIAVAVAFPAGWLVCRAWLNAKGGGPAGGIGRDKHHAMLQAQRSRYRRQVQRLIELVHRHEVARDQLRAKLEAVTARLDSNHQRIEHLQSELTQSRDALTAARATMAEQRATSQAGPAQGKAADNALSLMQIERDELRARVRRLEAEAGGEGETAGATASEAERRAERGELREKLGAAEHRRHELETRLADREARIEELKRTVDSWKQRVIPLTRQIQSYREAVRKLQQGGATAAPAEDVATDRLQDIKGIGPALERRLHTQGIRRYEQLAALEPVELAELADRLAISPNLPERDRWIEQARTLAESTGSVVAA